MKPTESQRARLAESEDRLVRWCKFQSAGVLVEIGMLNLALTGMPSADRHRAECLVHLAIDPATDHLVWKRLTDDQRREVARMLGALERK